MINSKYVKKIYSKRYSVPEGIPTGKPCEIFDVDSQKFIALIKS
jgi:hypothetical protein